MFLKVNINVILLYLSQCIIGYNVNMSFVSSVIMVSFIAKPIILNPKVLFNRLCFCAEVEFIIFCFSLSFI